jgi:hypothetical protein
LSFNHHRQFPIIGTITIKSAPYTLLPASRTKLRLFPKFAEELGVLAVFSPRFNPDIRRPKQPRFRLKHFRLDWSYGVIARLDLAIQYPPAGVYLIARSSRVMTA